MTRPGGLSVSSAFPGFPGDNRCDKRGYSWQCGRGETGNRSRLKICRLNGLRVRPPSPAPPRRRNWNPSGLAQLGSIPPPAPSRGPFASLRSGL